MAKILLADDSGTAQRMGSQILSAEGHEVATVSNGQAAIKMLDEFSPDLIVADVFMPGRSGYELCEFVKSDPKSAWIPVLLIVAPMEPYDATEGQRVKADGLVTKPLDKSNLVETVQALLASVKKPKKRGAAKAAAVAEPEAAPEPIGTVESLPEEDPTIPAVTTSAPVEFDIPEEMRNQPVSMIGDLLEPQITSEEASQTESLIADVPSIEASPLEIERNEGTEVLLEPSLPDTESEPAEPTGIERLFAAAESSPAETPFAGEPEMVIPTVSNQEIGMAPGPSWTAEVAEVTEEDKKLFRPEPPDWQGLVNLVQEEGEQGQFPAVSSAGSGAGSPTKPESASNSPEEPEPSSPNSPGEPEDHPRPAEAAEPAPVLPGAKKSASPNDTIDMMEPHVAPLDYATVEQIVRETIEEVMPQIVGRIEQATGIRFQKKDPKQR